MKLHWQILIAIVIGICAGLLTGSDSQWLGIKLLDVYATLGTLFLNALKMVSLPLVFCALISAMGGIANQQAVGRLGGKAALYYFGTSVVAVCTGLLVCNLIAPGSGADPSLIHANPAEAAQAKALVEGRGLGDAARILQDLVPPNLFGAAVNGNLLGLIFFALLYGFFITRLEPPLMESQQRFWSGAFHTMLGVTGFLLRFAPFGVFGLIARTVATTGLEAFVPLAWFMLTVTLGLVLHAMVWLPLALRFLGGVSPLRHFQAMLPALLTAFSSASSSATLPLTLECVEKRAGVKAETANFVLPIGASVNMDGTALYECAAALFIMQIYGVDLPLATQFLVLFLALLTSMGVAGIPAASLVAISIILGAVGLPLEALGLLLVTDRVLDMLRTTVNVWSDSCGVVIIARSEGETQVLAQPVR